MTFTWILQLFHELESHPARCIDEDDAPRAERRSGDDIRPPYDVVARDLGIDVVGEERDVQEALVGQVDFVLVERAREQRQL